MYFRIIKLDFHTFDVDLHREGKNNFIILRLEVNIRALRVL